MSRCLSLPYKANNPRSVRGARRQGWTVIKCSSNKAVSWTGLNIWCEMKCRGYWVSSHALADFAFENAADATLFSLKWG